MIKYRTSTQDSWQPGALSYFASWRIHVSIVFASRFEVITLLLLLPPKVFVNDFSIAIAWTPRRLYTAFLQTRASHFDTPRSFLLGLIRIRCHL